MRVKSSKRALNRQRKQLVLDAKIALRTLNLTAALAFTIFSGGALAQSAAVERATCQDVGISPQEPIGDRQGHSFAVSEYSCIVQGGVLGGGIQTGMNIWEWDKGSAISASGSGVVRKPGAAVVFVINEAKTSLMVANGQVTGYSGVAKGIYKVAAGAAAALAGKSFTSRFRSLGSGQFVIETTVD